MSDAERKFPLGFVITMHTAPQQVVRLLRVVYRPHNVYCIHPDAKASKMLADGMRQLAACLPNLVVPDHPLSVTYKHSSTLEAQLLCINEIRTHFPDSKWRYMLILCGRELPFSSNQEIVNVLKNRNGVSLVDSAVAPRKILDRMTYKMIIDHEGRLLNTSVKVGKPPHNIAMYFSSTYLALSKEFVNFFLTDKKARDFRRYMQDVQIPEEHFYASLYNLPEAPKGRGGGNGEVIVSKPYWTRTTKEHRSCSGKVVHNVCILTSPDLPRIVNDATKHGTTYFFFNKYYTEDDPVIMDCIERRILAQNIQNYFRDCMK